MTSRPLAGIRVLDLTNILAGPYCTRLLADVGAEVIKIEASDGDHNRHRPPFRDGRSTIYGQVNAGKKSVVLNLKSEAGLEAAVALARMADVVVENWRPGVADRLGLGYEALSVHKPDLVYCSISGYGRGGPKALLPAYAHIVHAASGLDLAQMKADGAAQPPRTAIYTADVMSGLTAFSAVQTALVQRERTGKGQFIDVAMMDCMLNLLVFELQEAQFESPARRINRALRTTDGFVCIAAFNNGIFVDLMRVIGRPELIDDPRFAEEKVRDRNWNEMLACVEEWTGLRSGSECERIFLAEEIPCARYREPGELLSDDHLLERGALTEVRDDSGPFMAANTPFRMPVVNVNIGAHVSDLGADSHDVLGSLLGYSREQVAAAGRWGGTE
ncbi:MAG: L-carnitine dehydratase/bile acid-inducible protein [Burkholderiales bacterium]|jgi:crotonobetainyl-CoA:carnitine CoA-transferase CaiB-like acyl-CoA transferase|nr:L-carnitine dehydratase/bile acid-inducible protein [Burkholderiales bacterium]